MKTVHEIPVTERELAKIIRACKIVNVIFGPGYTALKWEDDSDMPEAVELLGKMRGVLNENTEGAGI